MSLAVLSNQTLPLPILLDTVRHAETGHLSLDQARNARSTAGAIGPYQFLERYLPEFGYGMPTNIPVADVQDPARARELAGQYITGYSKHHDFQTPLQKLVAYNMGPNAAAEWIARGENVSELPAETQDYIRRAAAFLTTTTNQNQTIEEPKMSDFTYFGIPITSDIASQLQSVHEINKQRLSPEAAAVVPYFENQLKPNASATAVQENVLEAMQNKQMKGAPSNAPAPVLTPAPQASGATTSPALTDPVYIPITQAAGFSANPQPAASNRRDMSALAMTPPKPIGMNEMLIRMGAAGLGASAEGGLQSLEAIGNTYGAIQDANRATGLASYQAQMKALADGSTAKGREERLAQAGKIDSTLFDMQRALSALESGQAVTGWWDSTVGAAWDDFRGNPEAGTRLLLKKLKVDDALLRVAQTKGAISNNEMNLFLSPAPTDTQDEKIWMQWIRDRMVALQNVRQRLATGEVVGSPASQQQIDQFSGGNQQDYRMTEDDAALVNKYLQ